MRNLEANQARTYLGSTQLIENHRPDLEREARDLMYEIMGVFELGAIDLDKIYLKGGKIPLSPEGHIDTVQLAKQSPMTLPILDELNYMILHGIPFPTITGKSTTAILLADLQRRMLFEKASDLGMLEKPYVVEQNISGISFSSEIVIKQEFLEPMTGRMRAIDENGHPTDKLVLFYFARDNGGSRDEYWSDGSHIVDEFPAAFYKNFLRRDVLDLLLDSTRQSKLDRMTNINQVYFNAPQDEIHAWEIHHIDQLSNERRWEIAQMLSKNFSFASPEYGAKFNLELAIERILTDPSLKARWSALLQELTGSSLAEITDMSSIRQTIELLFPPELANVTLNYVDEENQGMGPRMIIDLNPPKVQKLYGLLEMIKDMEALYKKAHLPIPNFFRRNVRLGDGPDKNDRDLLAYCGWTNTLNYHDKYHGFPVDSIPMLERFDIKINPGMVLEDTEHTYMFVRLLAYRRFGKRLDGTPDEVRSKLILPAQLLSM